MREVSQRPSAMPTETYHKRITEWNAQTCKYELHGATELTHCSIRRADHAAYGMAHPFV